MTRALILFYDAGRHRHRRVGRPRRGAASTSNE